MLVKLSTKGQVALPKAIREAAGIGPGTVLKVVCEGQKIVLEPVTPSMIDRLYGKFAGQSLLEDLEAEHRNELLHEDRS
ncbi:MAG TPA: AbrB/MazE/SpoVT family DNA-binding domain-containing protein [Candidatus Binatia bacterium]|jgi:AbrB family looped-hinge helix DNA binding protein|nr:AbrB/MazE/SpoVT family DNA-binding domain-containing protein [Candidatus Binatia bacterium]